MSTVSPLSGKRTLWIITGIILVCLSLAVLVYISLPVETAHQQVPLAPTLFVAP